MRQLYIDGKPAVIKSGSSFKFYRENIYFTEAEDYTLDVTLPLQGCPENLDIFTAIHRPEMSLVHLIGKKYPFRFISPPLDISGSAIVTEINEQEVKVQLLAGATGLDLETIGKDIYIDELDLGKAFDVTHPGISVYDGAIRSGFYGASVSQKKSDYNNNPNGCVFFPVYSEGSETVVNSHVYSYTTTRGEHYSYEMGDGYDKFSAQPYLLLIIERVLNAIGYELDPNNAIAKSWQRNIFIVNGRNEFKYANILPHWTVNEFLKEVSLLCGVNFTVEGNIVNAIKKSDYYTNESEQVVIEDVIDEFTIQIEDEEEGSKDTNTGNVAYDIDDIDPMLLLPEEVWQKAEVLTFYSFSELETSANLLDKTKSSWLFVVSGNQKVYAFIEEEWGYVLTEVDMVGSIIRSDKFREIDIKLRIVPAQLTLRPIRYRYETERGFASVLDAFYVPMLKTTQAIDKKPSYFSVNNAINHRTEAEPEPSRPEHIEVALCDGGSFTIPSYYVDPNGDNIDLILPHAFGIPYARGYTSGSLNAGYNCFHSDTGSEYSFALKKNTPMYKILSSGKGIDTRVKRCFQFLDNIEPNPKAVFTIRGRKYACQKIEYTCEDEGVSPIKRGYFYEIKN